MKNSLCCDLNKLEIKKYMDRQYRSSEDEQIGQNPPWIGGFPKETEGTPPSRCVGCGNIIYGSRSYCYSCDNRKKKYL